MFTKTQKPQVVTKFVAYEFQENETIDTICLASIADDNEMIRGIGDTEKEAISSYQEQCNSWDKDFGTCSVIQVQYQVVSVYKEERKLVKQ